MTELKDRVLELRPALIEYRDKILAAADFHGAVLLSHTIALLFDVVEQEQKNEPKPLDPDDERIYYEM